MNPFDLPIWAKALILAALVAAAGWAVHSYNESLREDGRQEVRAESRAQAAIETEQHNKETFRRIAKQKESQDAYIADLSRARADAAGAAAASERLSVRVAGLVAAARAAGANPPAGGISPSTGDPIGVLAFVLGRADRRAGILAEFADASRAAGLQCQRDYDALAVKP